MATLTPEILALLERIYFSPNSSYFDERDRYCHRIPSSFAPGDLKALDDAGMMPNTFFELPHDDAVKRLSAAARAIDFSRAADAFVASLTSADLAWQAVLPAAALGLAIPEHAMAATGSDRLRCRSCFYCDEAHDVTLRRYFAHVQGTGFSDINKGPVEPLLTLERALAVPLADWPSPTPRDVWVFHRVLGIIREQPPTTRYSKVRDALKKAALLSRNNPYRCETHLEALAQIGLLATPDHPGFLTRFTTAAERDRRPNTRVEVPGPLGWWQASDGINDELLIRLFGHLGCPSDEPPAPATARTRRKSTAGAPRLPKRLPGPPAAGDVYAVRYREDLWGAVYCHQVKTDANGTTRGLVEYLDILSPEAPTTETLAAAELRFRDRRNGKRWQSWMSRLDADTYVRRVAKSIPPPPHAQPPDDRPPSGGAPELRHLASWNFEEL